MSFVWKLFKIREGVYTEQMDKIFGDLFEGNFSLLSFIESFVGLGDRIRYGWQWCYIIDRVKTMLSTLDVSYKYNKKGDQITIKIKKKTRAKVVAEIIANKV